MDNQKLVRDFMIGFNQIDDKPINTLDLTVKDVKHVKLRLTMTLEKTQEMFSAILDEQIYSYHFGPLFNILKNKIKSLDENSFEISKLDLAHTLADILYITYGTAEWVNIPLQKCFEEVHKSNMSKLVNFTGTPILREDGKILYDSSYLPPNIKSIIKE